MLTNIIRFLRTEPALTRAAGTFIIGAAGAIGLHVTTHQEAAAASGVMALIAVIQGWRTRRKVTPNERAAQLEAAAEQAGRDVLEHVNLEAVMGAWRNRIDVLKTTEPPKAADA